eukprot:3559248-Prymnesium_polylepis.1
MKHGCADRSRGGGEARCHGACSLRPEGFSSNDDRRIRVDGERRESVTRARPVNYCEKLGGVSAKASAAATGVLEPSNDRTGRMIIPHSPRTARHALCAVWNNCRRRLDRALHGGEGPLRGIAGAARRVGRHMRGRAGVRTLARVRSEHNVTPRRNHRKQLREHAAL